MINIDFNVAKRVLETVDAGLSSGLGEPIPGQMCVEAAVCFALGLPHSDDPICVDSLLREFKITLNDMFWSNRQVRAKGLRRLAVVQLGSRDNFSQDQFEELVYNLVITKYYVRILERAIELKLDNILKELFSLVLEKCKLNSIIDLNKFFIKIMPLYNPKYKNIFEVMFTLRNSILKKFDSFQLEALFIHLKNFEFDQDQMLTEFCEDIVQILVKMKVPGVQWLYLTE